MAQAIVAHNRRTIRAHNRDAVLAWNIANLSRAKKLSKADAQRLIMREPKRKQSWQEQLAIAEQWVADAARRGKQ